MLVKSQTGNFATHPVKSYLCLDANILATQTYAALTEVAMSRFAPALIRARTMSTFPFVQASISTV
jgi:hypothetical protein